ncbi:MAG: 2-C-methyl-D-erythritol 4-phosphate cytidylyltransferase [Mucispirillum sp.]|nr:2-C-methyl-D-erythritol 4-phosphate cytidylyltransferase [Mucispirillum sp.]
MSISLIIPAAGVGKRFSANIKKQFTEIDGRPLIYWTIKRLVTAYNFNELIIGLNQDDIKFMDNVISDLNLNIPHIYAEGGKERANTVLNCLLKSNCSYAAVHDSVRPFVSSQVVKDTIDKAYQTNAAICGMPVRDTVKKINENIIEKTIPRDNLFLAHTPQVFKKDIILNALHSALENNIIVTDEASACEYAGIQVDTVLSNYENIKVTYAEDISLIQLFKEKFFEV